METRTKIGFILCCVFAGIGLASSSYCYTTYPYTVRSTRSGTRSCGWWSRCRYYYDVYELRYGVTKICCPGYRGTACDIPICSATCSNRGVCIDVNSCYCPPGASGSTCSIRKCSDSIDCYPGTCNTLTTCSCSSGFEGTTCQKIRDGGSFTHCRATLNDGQLTEYESDCVAPNENIYTNIRNLQDIKLQWQVTYEPPSDIPILPPYVVYSHPGIVETYGKLRLYDHRNVTIYNGNQVCQGHNVSATNPYLTVQCRNQFHSISPSSADHNYRLEISFHSRTGGYKTYTDGRVGGIYNRTYDGSTYDSEPIQIIFDVRKPEHCSRESPASCTYDDQPALAVFPDNRQDIETQIQVFGWSDVDSYVKEYKFKMYKLVYDSHSNKLKQSGVSLINITWDPVDDPPEISFESGVYSIVMEINDMAGNMAKARTLFIAEQVNHIEYMDTGTITVNQQSETTLGFWTSTSGNIRIQWANLFTNPHHIQNHYYVAVEEDESIDFDDGPSLDGNRTTATIPHVLGITRFELGWRKLPSNIIIWEEITELDEDFTFDNLHRENGDSFNFTIRGYDRTQYHKSHSFLLNIDSTSPSLESAPVLELNTEEELPEEMDYASRLRLRTEDRESGIHRITFTVHNHENGFNSEIVGEQLQHVLMHPSSRQDQCVTSGRCYCIGAGGCFDKLQYVWINHCWFIGEDDLSRTRKLSIAYTIHNYAGVQLTPTAFVSQDIALSGLTGVQHYPVPENVGLRKGRGNTLDIVWHNPPSCYRAERIVFIYIEGTRERVTDLAGNATRHTLHDVKADTKFQIKLEVVYGNDQRPTTEPLGFVASFPESNSGLNGGSYAGIVIALIIFLLMAAALVFMFIRYRQNKHPVPVVIREARDYARDAISKRMTRMPPPGLVRLVESETGSNEPSVIVGVSYVSEDDDMYIYGGMETDPNATWKHSEDRLVIKGNVPGAKGRFADIKFGVLTVPGGEKKDVVVKMNKVGASKDDKLLMTAKMNFLATSVPENNFVVRLIGAIPPPRGPMLLLEYCNLGTLLAWLQNIAKVTGDVEEQMVLFTMQTAEGMAFIHNKGLLHRRLGARNVLLHKDPMTSQLIAKLSGFGPLKGEADDENGSQTDDRVPIKFMAPEQLDKAKGAKRRYTKKTDVWTYGILLWEIFSKGTKPYSDKTVMEMKAFVKNGGRIGRPSACPNFIYKETILPAWDLNPDMRPDFDCLLANLKREYGAQSGEDYAYDQRSHPLYGNDTS